MNTNLNHVKDWLALAKHSNWSVTKLAKQCGVSARTLERYFLNEFTITPKKWLLEQRQLQAQVLLRDGNSVKETAGQLGYKHPTHFSRDLKKYWNQLPPEMVH